MATNENLIPIPGRLHSVATEGHVSGADEIFDDTLNKDQATINQEVNEALGTGGSVDSRIAAAINALDASASQTAALSNGNLNLSVTETNGKVTAISGSIDDAAYIDDTESSPAVVPGFDPTTDTVHVTAQTLSEQQKAQVRTNIGLGDVDAKINEAVASEASQRAAAVSGVQASVNAEASRAQAAEQSITTTVTSRLDTQDAEIALLNGAEVIVVEDHTAVSSPDPQKIYREIGDTSYTDWMNQTGNANDWKAIATYEPGIDPVPSAESNNLVKSGGVADALGLEKNNLTTTEVYDGYVTPSGYEDTTTAWCHRYVYNISGKPSSRYKISVNVSNGIIAVCSVKDINNQILVVSQASSESQVFEFSTETYPTAAYIVASSMTTPSVVQTTLGNFVEIDKRFTTDESLINVNKGNIEKILSSQVQLQVSSTEQGYYTPTGYHDEGGGFVTSIYDVSGVDDIVIAKTTASNGIVVNALVKTSNGTIILLGDASSNKKYFCFSKKEYPDAKYLYVTNNATAWAVNDGVLGDIYKEITTNKEKVQYNILNNLKGQSIAWFGTSIPAGWENGAGYPNRMGALLGATVYNESKGGSCANGKLEGNYTMDLGVLILSLGHTIEQKMQIINSCWNIDDSNQTVSLNSSNPLGITGVPQSYTYQQAIDYRWLALSLSYEIRLVVWHLISDATERENFLKAKLGNTLYNQIVNVEERDVSYKAAGIFVFDHGNNDYNAGGYPYNSDDVTVFSGAINKFVETIYKWKPNSKIVHIANYRDAPEGVNSVIHQIAEAWGNPFIDISALLPFKVFKKVPTRGYWDSSKIWHETGFTWSESGNTYTTNLYLDGMDTNRVKGDLSLSQVKERINPTQIDGIWYWYANPIDIWLYDGLHPHQNDSGKVLQWYANTLAIEFLNKVKTY